MRDIKFRGKRLDNGEWVEGDYFRKYIYDRDDNVSLHHLIGWQVADNDGEMCNDYEDVDPATVGQYAGLKDKNGKEIFEGDILSDGAFTYEVRYEGTGFVMILDGQAYTMDTRPTKIVIGNIHDNPEFLEGGAK